MASIRKEVSFSDDCELSTNASSENCSPSRSPSYGSVLTAQSSTNSGSIDDLVGLQSQAEIARLREQVERLERENTMLKQENQAYRKLEVARHRIEEAEIAGIDAPDACESRDESLSMLLERERAHSDILEREMESVKQHHDTRASDFHLLQKHYVEEQSSLKTSLADTLWELEMVQSTHDSLNHSHDQLLKKYELLRGRHTALKVEYKTLQKTHTAIANAQRHYVPDDIMDDLLVNQLY